MLNHDNDFYLNKYFEEKNVDNESNEKSEKENEIENEEYKNPKLKPILKKEKKFQFTQIASPTYQSSHQEP